MNIAIILAGGVGTRIGGDIPKQFVKIAGQMEIMYSLLPFGRSGLVDNIQIVAADAWRKDIEDSIFAGKESSISEKFLGFSDPGQNRQLSIYNALKDIRDTIGESAVDGVIIHDAARPFVTVDDIEECLLALDEHDGAMPVLPMKDTVYYSKNGDKIDELMDRSTIYAGQAPEAFLFKKYYEANVKLLPDQILTIHGSTQPAIMAGMDVAMIKGNPDNFKITTKEDLDRAIEIITSGR